METGLSKGRFSPGKLWLIGLYLHPELKQFIYPKERKELLQFIKNNRIKSVASWTRYDHQVIKPILPTNLNLKYIDACQRIRNCCVYYTYKLDDFYQGLFKKNIPNGNKHVSNGYFAGLFADHLILSHKKCSNCPPVNEIKEEIIERNKDDLIKMFQICEYIYNGHNEGISSAQKSRYEADVQKRFTKNEPEVAEIIGFENFKSPIMTPSS